MLKVTDKYRVLWLIDCDLIVINFCALDDKKKKVSALALSGILGIQNIQYELAWLLKGIEIHTLLVSLLLAIQK